MTIAQALLPNQIELVEPPELVTSHAALPMALEAMRAGIPTSRYRDLRDALKYEDWKTVQGHVEGLALLIVAGGEHTSDLDVLCADRRLGRLLSRRVSCPMQAKDFLYRFHQGRDGHLPTADEDAALSVLGKAKIRGEGPALIALERLVLALGGPGAGPPSRHGHAGRGRHYPERAQEGGSGRLRGHARLPAADGLVP